MFQFTTFGLVLPFHVEWQQVATRIVNIGCGLHLCLALPLFVFVLEEDVPMNNVLDCCYLSSFMFNGQQVATTIATVAVVYSMHSATSLCVIVSFPARSMGGSPPSICAAVTQ